MREQVEDREYDAIVIGAGPAGLSAAIYLARANFRVLVIEKEQIGGQITITSEIVNYPGVIKSDGKELTANMRKQAEHFGAEFVMKEVTEIHWDSQWKKVLTREDSYRTLGLVIATGAKPRKIGFAGEEKYQGRGVAYCATCDGEFFTGLDVFVVGGGYAAAEESMFLAKYAKKVYLMIREEDFTCAKSIAEEVRKNPTVEVHFQTEIVEVGGSEILEYAVFREKGKLWKYTPQRGKTFGIFVFAGYVPDNTLFLEELETGEGGYLITDRNQKTSVEGVYGAGDVCVKNLRQVVTAVADGAIAATSLERYLATEYDRKNLVKAQKKSEQKELVESQEAVGLTEEVREQLQRVLDTLTQTVLIKVVVDKSELSQKAQEFVKEISGFSDKIFYKVEEGKEERALPEIRLQDADGVDRKCTFHGVPGGHEFNSFVIALYNMAGKGQTIEQELLDRIHRISGDIRIQVVVSLSCTMCPDLVMAVQRIALENPKVQVDIYDIAHFGELTQQYQIMSVPCMIVNEKQVYFGRKGIRELIEILEHY